MSKTQTGNQITINGETHNLKEWCAIYGISSGGVRSRLKAGMGLEEALTTPVRQRLTLGAKRVGRAEPKRLSGQGMEKSEKCRKCFYGDQAEGGYVCMYITHTYRRRPCPPGDQCTVYDPKKRRKQKSMTLDLHNWSLMPWKSD